MSDDQTSPGTLWQAQPVLDRAIGWVAIGGGVLALGVALLVTVSVLGRWFFSSPIEGDFEFVKTATALAVFCYLPYTQVQRGNIMVDSLTTRLPARGRASLDALGDLVYAGVAALMAHGLTTGALEALNSRETTMQLQLLVWPAIFLCAVLSMLLVLSALVSASRLLRGGA
ncbi:MAG: TRAP transporter small permease [Methylobacterium sp.]|nr:TRAP transporter small permease [Methylobacterium sp.]